MALELKNSLAQFGFNSLNICNSGEDAIHFSHKNTIDLILMDIHLDGGIDGIDCVNEIHKNKTIPIIYVTGILSNQVIHKAKQTKSSKIMVKPYKMTELKANVEFALYESKIAENPSEPNGLILNNEVKDTEAFLKEFGKKLKIARKGMNLTQINASAVLGMNYRHYQDIEGGKINLKLDTLIKLVNFYKISCEIK